jgi:hypothetical protein
MAAVIHQTGVVVGQSAVDQKTNEIKVAQPLLDPLDLVGHVVTADAMHTQAEFARYRQDQLFLPMDFSDMIAPHHVVRVVNDAVDQRHDAVFENVYPGGGRPPDHPKLMAKI